MERKIVLVVDDDETTAELLEIILEGRYQILHVACGLRALKLTKTLAAPVCTIHKGINVTPLSKVLVSTAEVVVSRLVTVIF